MKLTRILTLMIVSVMLVLSFASCGPVYEEITVTLIIIADDPENPILNTEVKLQSEKPTVLEAFIEGCIVNEISYNLSSENNSVEDIKDFNDYTDANGIAYYWMYFINNVEPTSGKADSNYISDGDVIRYEYVSFDPSTVTTKAK